MSRVELPSSPVVLLACPESTGAREFAESLKGRGFRTVTVDPARTTGDDFYHAVVLDLDEAPISGWRFIAEFTAKNELTPLLVLSSRLDVSTVVRLVKMGAFDVLEKPVALHELEARLRESLLAFADPAPASVAWPARLRRSSPPRPVGVGRIIGSSPAMTKVREQLLGIARFHQVATLVVGETGTGKEVVAEALHEMTAPEKPFLTVNCAAIPESLFESELFGHEAGSFTGAKGAKPGLLESVEDGTLLLDEVGELSPALQPKLLRVLQNRTFRRVGGSRDIELRARIVSATNRKLSSERQEGMRSDLYFRLAGFTIALSPLRHRREDIPLLANHFLLDFAARYPGVPTRISLEATRGLLDYPWHGNVRELRKVVEQAAMLGSSAVLDRNAIDEALDERDGESRDPASGHYRIGESLDALDRIPPDHDCAELGLNEFQQRMILEAFESHDRNLTRAARALRIPRTTLRDRLRRYGTL